MFSYSSNSFYWKIGTFCNLFSLSLSISLSLSLCFGVVCRLWNRLIIDSNNSLSLLWYATGKNWNLLVIPHTLTIISFAHYHHDFFFHWRSFSPFGNVNLIDLKEWNCYSHIFHFSIQWNIHGQWSRSMCPPPPPKHILIQNVTYLNLKNMPLIMLLPPIYVYMFTP